jgi:hypothetical protein
MKLPNHKVGLARRSRGKYDFAVPVHKRRLKTSDLHISLLRPGYSAVDSETAERHDAI